MAPQIVGAFKDVLDDDDILLTRREAAQYLRKSVPTLERWGRLGIGPEFIMIGNASRYRLGALRAYAGRAA